MQRQTIIAGVVLIVAGIGELLFRPEWLFVNTTLNELALLMISAL